MIVKELAMPLSIKKSEALLKRLVKDHPKELDIQQDFTRQLSGYKGEKALSYYLDYLPDKGYHIFHNLRLPSGKYFFQLDFLVLTNYFAIILECKNFYGKLFFDESFKQLIRKTNDQEEGFKDPISQAKWHQKQLRAWLQKHNFPLVPIDYLVIISNPSTIIETNARGPEIKKHVVHSQIFLERMEELVAGFKKEVLNEKSLRKLSRLLVKSHVPNDRNILDKYGLTSSDIVTGVQCPECGAFGMIRKQRKWLCPKCGTFDTYAHLEAMKDYFLLVGSSIANQQFRNFVHISSVDSASKLLLRMNLPFSGTNKGRKYYCPPDFY